MSQGDAQSPPIIGMDIAWDVIEGQVFRVTEFSNGSRVDGDQVKGPLIPFPYGLLTVESPILNQLAIIPVNHKINLLMFHWIYTARGLDESEELLVTYMPLKGFKRLATAGAMIPLQVMIAFKGQLEAYYADDRHWKKPLAQEIFGRPKYLAKPGEWDSLIKRRPQ